MPWGNRTGPWGLGPMTGRVMGYCAGYPVPGSLNPGWGWGYGPGLRGYWGRGRRRARFFAWGFPRRGVAGYDAPVVASPPYPGELELLKEQAAYFEEVLSDVKKRIGELETRKKEE
ncbi:MAG: DUF5320 domain-containing protein [Bacillota bacterium]